MPRITFKVTRVIDADSPGAVSVELQIVEDANGDHAPLFASHQSATVHLYTLTAEAASQFAVGDIYHADLTRES